ncbi:MAG: molybdate ABC transporter substrate-binding protein [Pikeienuella sp.]
MRCRIPILVFCALASLAPWQALAQTDRAPLMVFAASSLADPITAAADNFERQNGIPVRTVFGASSTLVNQVVAGAPAEVIISANGAWMDRLEAAGLIIAGSRREIAGNSLVLVAAGRGAPPPSADPAEILLGTPGDIAVGDPALVPVGFYAHAALDGLGIWEAVAPRVAPTASTEEALDMVARGAAPFGIVYRTDAGLPEMIRRLADFPEASHPPIRYHGAVVAGGAVDLAEAFLDHLTGAPGQSVFRDYGFSIPQARSPTGQEPPF